LKILDKNDFSITGDRHKWELGWGEVFNQYKKTNDVSSLSAKFPSRSIISRLNGEYIHPNSHDFHQSLYTSFHYWAFEKYFKNAKEIFDFGCGTGENIKHISDVYTAIKLHGLDWAQSSVDIVNLMAKELHINAEDRKFNIFEPDYEMDMPNGSAVYTCESLEQVGDNFRPFLNFLLAKKPYVVVHFEPIKEFYDNDNLLDYLAIKYHTLRKYLNGYYTELIKLEKQGLIRILKQSRIRYGGTYHDSSVIVWEVL
jgi:SAM-dependent methyltransferase